MYVESKTSQNVQLGFIASRSDSSAASSTGLRSIWNTLPLHMLVSSFFPRPRLYVRDFNVRCIQIKWMCLHTSIEVCNAIILTKSRRVQTILSIYI